MIGTRAAVLLIVALLSLELSLNSTAAAVNQTGFLSVSGRAIVDSSGKPILLRGVNYPSYANDPYGSPSPMVSDYAFLASKGFNVVRLPISWELLEPEPGIFDSSYLYTSVGRAVQWAKTYGLYIVVDMHQYNWAQRFGGSGIPNWAVEKYPATEQGLRRAISDFWVNTGLQDDFANVWRAVARAYANEPAVAGWDILNEPWIYTSINPNLNASYVDAFYLRVINAIRQVDQNHIIFIEPANMQTLKLASVENIVWSPHFYPLSFAARYTHQNASVLEADLEGKYEKFVVEAGNPMWIGEFEAYMPDGSAGKWLEDVKSLFDKYQVGWAWWAFEGQWNSIPDCLSNPSTTTNTIIVLKTSDEPIGGRI